MKFIDNFWKMITMKCNNLDVEYFQMFDVRY